MPGRRENEAEDSVHVLPNAMLSLRSNTMTLADAWLRRTWAFVCLLRPVNMVMVIVGVFLGGVLSVGIGVLDGDNGVRLLKAALSAALIGGAANSLNDVLDLEIDRINRPERPLPAGWVSANTARLVWVAGSLGGVALALALSPTHLALALGVVGLLVLYNVMLKRTPLTGNLVVALVIALVLLYGGWAVGSPGPAIVGAGFAFLTTLAREIVKDIDDMVGDAVVGARTLPLVYGIRAAVRCTVGVVFLTLLLTPLPFLLLDYRGLFLVLMLIADALLLHVLWIFLGPKPETRARYAERLLKAVMIAGMGALALGALVQLGD